MLDAPGGAENLRVGLGCRGESGLVAFVCAIPSPLVYDRTPLESAVEVSLLCVHREWRGRGLTKLLLAELRRRADVADVRCAIFTEARPRYTLPMLRADCYHRPLSVANLVRSGFWELSEQETRMARKLSHLPRGLPRALTHPPGVASLPPCKL